MVAPSVMLLPSLEVRTADPAELLQVELTIEDAVKVGIVLTVRTILSETFEHDPCPVDVSVNVIAPVVVGVNVGFSAWMLSNVPPALVQVMEA